MQRTFIFDIDHTLYPFSPEVEEEITSLIDAYLMEERGLDPKEARALRDQHYHLFGTTLAGLLYFEQINAQDYLKYKDRFRVEKLAPDEAALEAVRKADAQRIAITNSHRNHGERVLSYLGLRDHFDRLYAIEDMGFWGKPFRKSFDQVFADFEFTPERTVFFEDSMRNLAYPKALGMTTILINDHSVKRGEAQDFVDYHVSNLAEAMEIANEL